MSTVPPCIDQEFFQVMKQCGITFGDDYTGVEFVNAVDKKIKTLSPIDLLGFYESEPHYLIANLVHNYNQEDSNQTKQFKKSETMKYLRNLPNFAVGFPGMFVDEDQKRDYFKRMHALLDLLTVVRNTSHDSYRPYEAARIEGNKVVSSTHWLCKTVPVDQGNGTKKDGACILVPLEQVAGMLRDALYNQIGYHHFQLLNLEGKDKEAMAGAYFGLFHEHLKMKGIFMPVILMKKIMFFAKTTPVAPTASGDTVMQTPTSRTPVVQTPQKPLCGEERVLFLQNFQSLNAESTGILAAIQKNSESTNTAQEALKVLAITSERKRAMLASVLGTGDGIDYMASPPNPNIGSPTGLASLARSIKKNETVVKNLAAKFNTPNKK